MLTRRYMLGLLGGGAPALLNWRSAYASPSLAPKPLVLAHRGASAWRPEHTLGAYAKAMLDGADYIEPDLVMSKDGHLVVRHESNIADTTDVANHPEFANRYRSCVIDGETQTGWFTTDFTLAELKTLRARERLPSIRAHNTRYDGCFEIPTFDEVIDAVAAQSSACGKVFGLIPEIKHSTHFQQLGLNPETVFLDSIARHRYTQYAPLEVQSLEVGTLKRIRTSVLAINSQARLMLLMGERADKVPDLLAAGKATTFGELMTPEGLKEIKQYADVIGPSHTDLIARTADGSWGAPTSLIEDAHKVGLLVPSYTAQPENTFLPRQLRTSGVPAERNPAGMMAEVQRYLTLGLDGFFTDDPALGRKAVDGV